MMRFLMPSKHCHKGGFKHLGIVIDSGKGMVMTLLLLEHQQNI